jgi:hypothetical protein
MNNNNGGSLSNNNLAIETTYRYFKKHNFVSRDKLKTKVKIECFDRESNTGPSDLQSDALPTELSKHLLSVKVST